MLEATMLGRTDSWRGRGLPGLYWGRRPARAGLLALSVRSSKLELVLESINLATI